VSRLLESLDSIHDLSSQSLLTFDVQHQLVLRGGSDLDVLVIAKTLLEQLSQVLRMPEV